MTATRKKEPEDMTREEMIEELESWMTIFSIDHRKKTDEELRVSIIVMRAATEFDGEDDDDDI